MGEEMARVEGVARVVANFGYQVALRIWRSLMRGNVETEIGKGFACSS